jgi:hypothetical protein
VLSVPQKPTSSNVAKVVSPVVMDQGKGANRASKAVNEDIVSYANTWKPTHFGSKTSCISSSITTIVDHFSGVLQA